MFRASLLLACLAAPVHAQSNCAPHADVVAGLERNYGETRQASGLDGNGALMELFGSGEGYVDAAPNA